MAPPAASPDATTQSDPGTWTRSSGLITPQMNCTFPSASQPAARGLTVPCPNASVAATDNPASIEGLISVPPRPSYKSSGHVVIWSSLHLVIDTVNPSIQIIW